MKKLLLLTFFLASIISLFGQSTKITLDSTHHYYLNGAQQLQLNHRYLYQYDDKANLVSEAYFYRYDPTLYQIGDLIEYTYNQRGINDSIVYSVITIDGNYSSKYLTNNYNKDTLLTKQTTYFHRNDTILSTFVHEWEYDDEKRLIKETNNDISRFCWTYNEKGLLADNRLQKKEQGVWTNQTINFYVYNADDLITEHLRFNQNGALSRVNTYYYYNQNRQVTHILDRKFDGFLAKDSSVYNTQNQLIEHYYFRWKDDNDTWDIHYLRFLYAYDNHGNQFEEIEQYYDMNTNQWLNFRKEYSLYNNKNQKTHDYWGRLWNDTTNTWYRGFERTFSYNEFDLVSEVIMNEWSYNTGTFLKPFNNNTYDKSLLG